MNRKICLLFTLSWLGILFSFAQSKGVVAVMVSADAESSKFSQMIKTDFESGLSDYGFNPVEMGQDFLDAVQAYNTFLQEGAVSEFAFDDDELEERANYLFHIRIKRLGKGSYSIEVTKTKYGQTNAESKKVYPDYGLNDDVLNLEKDAQRKCKMAVEFLLERLGYSNKGKIVSSTGNNNSTAVNIKKNIDRDKRKVDSEALVASMFVPGAGQFYKHDFKGGPAFMVSELALIGSGTACFFLMRQQQYIHDGKDNNSSSDSFYKAEKLIPRYKTAMYVCYGVAAALHIGNMIHAWYTPDNNYRRYSVNIFPAIIPSNDFFNPSYAMGAGIQIKF